MENFILSLNVVLPLFLIMAVGYLLRRIGLLDGMITSSSEAVDIMRGGRRGK